MSVPSLPSRADEEKDEDLSYPDTDSDKSASLWFLDGEVLRYGVERFQYEIQNRIYFQ